MGKIFLFALLLICATSLSVRPPAPTCRTSPLPSLIPVSIGQTVRIDLERVFDGFNLRFEGIQKDHITITPKWTHNQSDFEHSFNFSNARIKDHNRFLGIATNNQYTMLAIGTNHPESGITIEKTMEVEDVENLRCYDVDEIIDYTSNKAYAIIDCGYMRFGELIANEFLFVDLSNYKLFLGSKMSDVYVPFHHLQSRKIQIMTDPFTHIEYLVRFYTTEGVDTGHADQTYVQIFMMPGSIMEIQILDVIDHTLLNLPHLAIMDFQIHMNFIYLLVKDEGLFQIQFTPTQRLQRTAYFPIKMNVNRFRVEQNGFNDDLHVIFSNDNTVYQYEWDVVNAPVLVTKYNLMSGSVVEDLLMDENFVIVQAWVHINDQLQRRTWIFSRSTLSYMNAFGSFVQPSYGPSIIIYNSWERSLHLIHEYRSYNIRLNAPYLINNPIQSQKAGQTQTYVLKATSIGDDGTNITCSQTFNFIYIENSDPSIFKTGIQERTQMLVDAPDDAAIDLQWEFFGRNLSYTLEFENEDKNQTAKPDWYVEKRVKATLNFPSQIDQTKIVYYEIFSEDSLQQIQDKNQIYGIVQIQQSSSNFPIYYILCNVQIDAQFVNPVLKCRTLHKSNLGSGKIYMMSQMYSPKERVGAIIFEAKKEQIYLYNFYSNGVQYYGMKSFHSDFMHLMTGATITMKGLLVVTFAYGKRIQVYKVEDIHHAASKPATAIMQIDHRVMAFFGIDYFSPVGTKFSIYHDQVVFIETKTGVMAININQMGLPELLFHIKTTTANYAFEVSRNTLVIVTETYMGMYRMTTPLRRAHQPFLLQKFSSNFNINEYDEINSDGLFYLVQKNDTSLLVIHPNMPSTSVIYSQLYVGNIKMIDAVRLSNKEVLLLWNGKEMMAYMFAQNPTLRIRWNPDQGNFTMNLTAKNQKVTSQPYTTKVQIIPSNQAFIEPTQKFNETEVRKLGHVKTQKNTKKIDMNITLNDTQWFSGNVLNYQIKCKDCNKHETDEGAKISLQNHLTQIDTKIEVGEPVYDMHATYLGIFGQMYNAIFKTHFHNDSVEYIITLPTTSHGEVCSKMAVQREVEFLLSFCESGAQVNVYITTLNSYKPFTYGPFETQAKAVNHVEIVGNIVMIVDNNDDPYMRAGGVYLYYLNFQTRNQADMFNMLDYLDYEDLQIEGFRGYPYIASADIHKPLYNQEQYAIFLTEARTGNIFVFLFELSNNKKEAVYLHRRMIPLNRLFANSVKHPEPLRVININIIDYTVRQQTRMRIQYVLLLTVRNWHHVEVMLTFDEDYDLLFFEVARLFERVPYPFELTNFIRVRKGALNASYFSVTYRDYEDDNQLMAVYELPYFRLPSPNKAEYKKIADRFEVGIPVTKAIGGYSIPSTHDLTFAFNVRDEHRILFDDIFNSYLTEIELNKQLKIVIKDADPSIIEGQNITIIAQNHYMKFPFLVQLSFTYPDDNTEKVEIIWIIILVIGFLMIIGLIFVWSKQAKTVPRESAQIKQSLLTVQPQFKSHYINRSSADPESVRDTVDYSQPTPVPTRTLQKEVDNQENQDKSAEELQENKQEQESKPSL